MPTVLPAFVLLFAVTPDAAAKRADPPAGLVPIPDEVSESYRSRLEALQQRLLGEPYLQARRLQRISVGRLNLPVVEEGDPTHGTLAKTHGYTAEATALGETLFGIDDLFDSVVERLEALTFEITTRNQQSVSQLGFWLTTSFGAIETGFVASSIATWYYADNLGAVLGWTIGVTLVTALVISSLLRWRLKS